MNPDIEKHFNKVFGRISRVHSYVDAKIEIGKRNIPSPGQNEFFGCLQDLLLRIVIQDTCVLIEEKANITIDKLIESIKDYSRKQNFKERWGKIKEDLDNTVIIQFVAYEDTTNISNNQTGENDSFIHHNGKLYKRTKDGRKKLKDTRNKEIAHLDFNRTAYDPIDAYSITTFCEETYNLLRETYKELFNKDWPHQTPYFDPLHSGFREVLEKYAPLTGSVEQPPKSPIFKRQILEE